MLLTNWFLRAKHWQLFLLTCGLPVLFQLAMMASMIVSIGSDTNPDAEAFFNIFRLFPLMMLLFVGTFFGWFWSVAIGLQGKIPPTVKMKTGKFKFFFFTPLIYILFLLIWISAAVTGLPGMEGGERPGAGAFGVVAIIIPMHLFSMFCMMYSLYFVAKTFKTVELQRETTFSDFAGEFFLFWFFPIGVWVVQPKINKMIAGDSNTSINWGS